MTGVGAPAPPVPQVEVVRSGPHLRARARLRCDGTVLDGARRIAEPGLARERRRRARAGSAAARRRLRERMARHAGGATTFDIAMEWTPQRQVWAALWISVARRGRVPRHRGSHHAVDESSPAETAAHPDIAWTWSTTRDRNAWIAPLLAGVLDRDHRRALGRRAGCRAHRRGAMATKTAGLCPRAARRHSCSCAALYITVQQARHHYPPGVRMADRVRPGAQARVDRGDAPRGRRDTRRVGPAQVRSRRFPLI